MGDAYEAMAATDRRRCLACGTFPCECRTLPSAPTEGDVLSAAKIADHREGWMAWRSDPEHGEYCSCPNCLSADTVAAICDSHEILGRRLAEAEAEVAAFDSCNRARRAAEARIGELEGALWTISKADCIAEAEMDATEKCGTCITCIARAALTGGDD